MAKTVAFTSGESPSMENFNKKFAEIIAQLTLSALGAAPAGYGFGMDNANGNYETNPDGLTKTGYYICDGSAFGLGKTLVHHMQRQPGFAVQEWYVNYYNTAYGYNVVGRRSMDDGVWGEFEWVNPLMQPGVEYRTTERYLGKPVYAKLINCGAMVDQKVVSTGVENMGAIIRSWANHNGAAILPYDDESEHLIVGIGGIAMRCSQDFWGGDVLCAIFYTKTTD